MKVSKRVQEFQEREAKFQEKFKKLTFTCEEDDFRWFDNHDTEEGSVFFIKKYLRTPEQKEYLNVADLSIEDCLNGRYSQEHAQFITEMYSNWNKKLGFWEFGFSKPPEAA